MFDGMYHLKVALVSVLVTVALVVPTIITYVSQPPFQAGLYQSNDIGTGGGIFVFPRGKEVRAVRFDGTVLRGSLRRGKLLVGVTAPHRVELEGKVISPISFEGTMKEGEAEIANSVRAEYTRAYEVPAGCTLKDRVWLENDFEPKAIDDACFGNAPKEVRACVGERAEKGVGSLESCARLGRKE